MDDRDALEQRIDDLEGQLERTQSQLSQLLPTRRDVLKLGGAAAGGALLHHAASPAQAAAVGQIGTATDRVDVYGEDVDVESQLAIPVYADDTNAPNETHFWHSGESAMKYKDGSGTVFVAGSGQGLEVAAIDNADSPYNTNGEDLIIADDSAGDVMVELSTTDWNNGESITVVYRGDGSNSVDVRGEGPTPIQVNTTEKRTPIGLEHEGIGMRFTSGLFTDTFGDNVWTSTSIVQAGEIVATIGSTSTQIYVGDDLVPSGDGTQALGSSSKAWADGHFDSITDGAGVSHTGELADDGDAQPPESHGDSAHSPAYIDDGDGTKRQIWVIANGASDPAGAGAEDIILEEES